jgi:hypothetical protein
VTSRRETRIALGAAGVCSPEEAAERLPVRTTDARAWLDARGLIRDVPGLGRVVLWADVLDEIRLGGAGPASPPPEPRARLPRKPIRPRR